jgi:acetyltransferase-like isoleucine patch superfamily enzyme
MQAVTQHATKLQKNTSFIHIGFRKVAPNLQLMTPSSAWTEAYRQQRFEFNPWHFRAEATEAEKAAQAAHQQALAAMAATEVGDACYLAPSASITGKPGSSLKLGDHCFVAANSYVTDDVRLGHHCTLNPFVTLRGKIRGGDGIRIGAYTCMVGFNHGFADVDVPIFRQPHTSKGIVLGDDIWVGAHVTVLDGVKVGSHSILAAGAVVTKDVPDYAIVGGNPARVIRMRKATTSVPASKAAGGSLEKSLEKFGGKVGDQLESLLKGYLVKSKAGGFAYVNERGAKKRVRPWCDAVEVAAMFGRTAPGFTAAEWVTRLREFQDKTTGLVPEHIPEDRAFNPPPPANPEGMPRYNTMALNYALECLGSNLAHPVRNAAEVTVARLKKHLNTGLPWSTHAWWAGDWIDCYASCLMPNLKYFGIKPPLESLFMWLDSQCDTTTGLWGKWTEESRWLHPVNGFYRLTRGTYAQYGRALPHPERAIDTILEHTKDKEFFAGGRENACNVLDVVHPLWLCLRQTDHRREEALAWMRKRLPQVLKHWKSERGFDFVVAGGKPSLQGTEMWLSIIYLMCDLLGCAQALGYQPKGVHRLEPALRFPRI